MNGSEQIAPIHISLDLEVPGGAGYVRYSRRHAVSQNSIDEENLAIVDLDADGVVVGIELTSLDADACARAHEAAAKYKLMIPDLSGLVKTRWKSRPRDPDENARGPWWRAG